MSARMSDSLYTHPYAKSGTKEAHASHQLRVWIAAAATGPTAVAVSQGYSARVLFIHSSPIDVSSDFLPQRRHCPYSSLWRASTAQAELSARSGRMVVLELDALPNIVVATRMTEFGLTHHRASELLIELLLVLAHQERVRLLHFRFALMRPQLVYNLCLLQGLGILKPLYPS